MLLAVGAEEEAGGAHVDGLADAGVGGFEIRGGGVDGAIDGCR